MIRRYETVFIVDSTLNDDKKIDDTVDKFIDFLKSQEVNILNIDKWGKKRLAYLINKKQYGFYTSIEFEAEGTVIAELERIFRLDEMILRYMTIVETKIMEKARLARAAKALKKAQEESAPVTEES